MNDVKKGLIRLGCSVALVGSFFLIAALIQRILLGEGISFSSNTLLPTPSPTVLLEQLPQPVRALNKRAFYPDRPDFWGWQAPWFQNLPSTTSFSSTSYHDMDSTLPPAVFKTDATRKKVGGNQFLIHLGPARDPWWVGAEPGRLHFVPFDREDSITFDFEGIGPDLTAVTTAYFNGTEERILIGSPRSNIIGVFKTDGQSITQIQKIRFETTGETGVRFIQMANIEGRRQADLLVATASWLLTTSVQGGVITNDPTAVASFYGVESLLVHDFSGDGQDEIVIADWDSVMSLFEIHNGILVEKDHWEFPVKLLMEGRRCPTHTKLADLDGDTRKELIVYEGYEAGRLTQRVHIFSWDDDEKQLVRHPIISPHFSGWNAEENSATHLAEIFPLPLYQNKKDILLLLRWFKAQNREALKFDFVRYDKDRGWIYDNSLHVPDGESPFQGTIEVEDQEIILGKNQAWVVPKKAKHV